MTPMVPVPRRRGPFHGIVDAQVHVWAASTPERPWPPTVVAPQRDLPLGIDELLAEMNAAGVQRALLVPPTWEGPRNDLVASACLEHPDRFGALFRLDPTDPKVVSRLARTYDTPGMLGVRLSINRGDREAQVRAAEDSGFLAAAEQIDVPLSIYAPGSYELLDRIAADHPGLRLTVDHLALEDPVPSLIEAVRPLMRLSRHANVAVKASALPCFVNEMFPFPEVATLLPVLVDEFGADRVFWGSDLSRLPCTYPELVEAFMSHMPRLSDSDLALVMGDALVAWLSWPMASSKVSEG